MSKELISELSEIFDSLQANVLEAVQDYAADSEKSLMFSRYSRLTRPQQLSIHKVVEDDWNKASERLRGMFRIYNRELSELMCKMAVEDANKLSGA